MVIRPSFGLKSKEYDNLRVTVITARERRDPKDGRERIEWKLMTDLPVETLEDAVEKLNWYGLRWEIEVYFKILKSGCKIADSKLRSAEALAKFISLNCIIAWRIFWITMISRISEEVSASLALTDLETKVLDKLRPESKGIFLSDYAMKIAKLGGYLARSSDPPPGNRVMWRGLQKLNDIVLGVEISKDIYG